MQYVDIVPICRLIASAGNCPKIVDNTCHLTSGYLAREEI
jgi:hypothetical protein